MPQPSSSPLAIPRCLCHSMGSLWVGWSAAASTLPARLLKHLWHHRASHSLLKYGVQHAEAQMFYVTHRDNITQDRIQSDKMYFTSFGAFPRVGIFGVEQWVHTMVSISTLRCNQCREHILVVFFNSGAVVPFKSHSDGPSKVSGQ